MRLTIASITISTALMLVSAPLLAAPNAAPTNPNHFDIILGAGAAKLSTADSNLSITHSETDRLVQTSGNEFNTFTGQVGAGYVFYFDNAQQYSENLQWFPSIEPEINGYFIGQGNIKGDVLRFGNPAFNDMTYRTPINSYRAMFDTALTIVSKRHLSLYAIAGVGNAWNRASYSDADRNGVPCADQALRFNSNTRSGFAWEAGAGVAYSFNKTISLSLEYLYADLGKVRTAASGSTGAITTPVIIPADINFSAQSALLALHIAI